MRFSMGTMMSKHEKISDSHLELFIVFHRFSTKPSLPYPDFGLQATTIGMGGSYLKYSRYTPEVLEYFFWNIFFGMFWNIFGKGYLIPPPRTIPGIFLALSSPYTWNIFEYIFSDCLTYLGMKYHVVCRKLQYLHRNPSRSRQPDMTAWFC